MKRPRIALSVPLLSAVLLSAFTALAAPGVFAAADSADPAEAGPGLMDKPAAEIAPPLGVVPMPAAAEQVPPTPPDPDAAADQESAASAVDRLFSPEYHACMDAAAGVTVPMQDCMNAEVERLEKRIAEQRARLAPTLSEERRKALAEALGAWESLRKNGSAAMYDPDGGTLAATISSLWYLEQTARMAHWLANFQDDNL